MKKKIFTGVYTAMVTPMKQDQSVDYEALEAFADYLIGQGIHGLIPLGSTGEFYALNDEERSNVIDVTLKAAAGRVPVIAGTNAASTKMVIKYSRQAEKAGVDGLLLAPPYYSLPTMDELFEHYRAVNDAVQIPIMLYNYPGRAGVDMTCEFIESLTQLDRVRYVKESTGDVARINDLISRCGDRLGVFAGGDTVALESFAAGATGWVGGIANVLPAEHVKLFDLCVIQNDYTAGREHYYKILPGLRAIESSGKYTQFVKAGCALKDHPVGPPRQPLMPATQDEIKALKRALQKIG
jgi:4-hydroxy-tetrahydrodipicolinate synthase